MTEKIKTYVIIVLLLLLCVSISVAVNYYYKSAVQDAEKATKKILDSPVVPVSDRFADNLQENHAEIKASTNTIPAEGLKDSDAVRNSIIDTVAKALKLADASRIQEVTQENLQLLSENIKLRAALDSTGKLSYNYADQWLKVAYHPLDTTVSLKYNVNLTAVKYLKKGFLFSQTPMLDFYADDPRATVNGVKHFTVAEPAPLFTLTANVRTAYDFYTGKLIPSAGISLGIGKLNIGARYFWSPRDRQLEPIASIGYNFLQLER